MYVLRLNVNIVWIKPTFLLPFMYDLFIYYIDFWIYMHFYNIYNILLNDCYLLNKFVSFFCYYVHSLLLFLFYFYFVLLLLILILILLDFITILVVDFNYLEK